MKKFFTLIALALAAVSANAQTTTLSAKGIWDTRDDVTVSPDGSAKQRTGKAVISVTNDAPIAAVAFDIVVPEGCELRNADKSYFVTGADYADRFGEGVYDKDVEDEDGEVIGTEKAPYWTGFGATAKTDGSIYCPVIVDTKLFEKYPDAKTYQLPAGEGAIGYIEVRVPSDFAGGKIQFKNVGSTIIKEDGNTATVECPDFEVEITPVSTEISTAIDRVDAQTLTGKEIYNLSGQRVSKPSQRGIYIVDGKKIMVK